MIPTDTRPRWEAAPCWPISGANYDPEMDAPRLAYLRSFQVDSFAAERLRPRIYIAGFYSTSGGSFDLRHFASWSSSSAEFFPQPFRRLADLVAGIASRTVPEASGELWNLIEEASQLRAAEPGPEDEIEEWADQLTNQVLEADD